MHDVAATRRIEAAALDAAPAHALMQRAGQAVARLAMATAPQGRSAWVMAGPGNNGGDGLVAASLLHRQGWSVRVNWLGDPSRGPADALWALAEARAAGVSIATGLPTVPPTADVAIDGLLGLGASRAPEGAMAQGIALLNQSTGSVLAIDLPSGLSADRGLVLGEQAVVATHTLSLLTLKPGLFTAQGRDRSGRVWLDNLGVAVDEKSATAWLIGPPAITSRLHAQHKGSFGEVLVLGGAPGMGGAAMLAARAALAAGAGRVYLCRLDGAACSVDPLCPEVMPRGTSQVLNPATLASCTVVCGCGGGSIVGETLPLVLHHAAQLVLDADALNAVAASTALQLAVRGRAHRGLSTVITPHPLEAARLLSTTAAAVQADRLGHAQLLAERLACHVVLKGSGTVLAAPGAVPRINPTGNARLASAGTGDVLAGWLGGKWASLGDANAMKSACATVWRHGRSAEAFEQAGPVLAGALIQAMSQATT